MKLDTSRQYKLKYRESFTETRTWRLTVIILTVIALTAGGGFYLYKTRNTPLDTAALKASYARLTGWAAEHKDRLGQRIQKVKQIAVNNAEQPIHYEFYPKESPS